MTGSSSEMLKEVGFRDVAGWVSSDKAGGIRYQFNRESAEAGRALFEIKNALYAFVANDQVMYIGKTAKSLKQRFTGYCTPGSTQQTNAKCNSEIKKLLEQKSDVRIFVFTPISYLRYGDFAIDLAAGLENGLISTFEPAWNGGKGKAIAADVARELQEIDAGGIPDCNPESDVVAEGDFPELSDLTTPSNYFKIALHDTSYINGYINAGVKASRHLGDDREAMIIYLGDVSRPTFSEIDRRANVNKSVRLWKNRKEVAVWFQQNFEKSDTVSARIIDRNHIILMVPGVNSLASP